MNKLLNSATEQVHIAAQFLAMAGKYFVEAKSDDSHTNMDWDLDTQQFLGRPLTDSESILMLRPADLRLAIGHSPGQPLDAIFLDGRTIGEGFTWLRSQLSSQRINVKLFQMKVHYDLPKYVDLVNHRFEITDLRTHRTFGELRSLGKKTIHRYKTGFEMAEEDRTWPHHFDHGCYVPLVRDEHATVTHSITLGLAIHDQLIKDHYFYVTHWSKNKQPPSKIPSLVFGHWNLDQLRGAALPFSDISHMSSVEQEEAITEFLQSAVDASKSLLHLSN